MIPVFFFVCGKRRLHGGIACEGIVGSTETKSPFDTKKRRKNDIEREEKLETEGRLNEKADNGKTPADDFVQVSVLEVLDVDDVALVEEGNESTTEDETASDSAVEEGVVELDGPSDGDTNCTADVLLKEVDPGKVFLGKDHLEERIKKDIDALLHVVTKRSTEGNSLCKLELDDHDCSKETAVETAESLVELVGIDSTHDKGALAKEELTVGQLVDIHDAITILIDLVVLLVFSMELLECLIKIGDACAHLLESTALLEGLDHSHDCGKVCTTESDNETVDHDDRVLRHDVVHCLALAIGRNDVGPCDNKAAMDGVGNRGKRMHCVLDTLRHVFSSAPEEAANARVAGTTFFGLLVILRLSSGHFRLGLGLPLGQNLLVLLTHLVHLTALDDPSLQQLN